ncbi:unnamed protein product, partial [Oppiella nova]
SSCPLSAPQDSVFPVEKNQNTEIEVDVRDDSGRSFYNISTLDIVWSVDGTDNEIPNGVKEVVNGAKGYFAITRNVQIMREFLTNSVKISAEIIGYKKQYKDKFKIRSEIELISVDKAAVDSDNIAIFNHPKQKEGFRIAPKVVGGGVIQIEDLCLISYGNTDLYYSVVEATDIRIEIVDKFQLGSVVDGYLSVIDNNGNYIDSVFAPLRIVPSNLTLIVGAHFQVTTLGGPQPQRNIEYSLVDKTVARVDSNGLIVGSKLGKTKLIVRVLSVENIEYSRSEIDLHVVALNKIKIVSHSSQLRIGSQLPLQLMGANEFETPFSFGSAIPALRITWSLSNENIATIGGVFQKSGIVDKNFESISVRLGAIST